MITKLQSINPERLGIKKGRRQDTLREGNNKQFMSGLYQGRGQEQEFHVGRRGQRDEGDYGSRNS